MIKVGDWVKYKSTGEIGKVRVVDNDKYINGVCIDDCIKLPVRFKGFKLNKNGQVNELRRIRGYEHAVQFVCTDDGFAAYSYFKVGTLFMSMGNKECGTPDQAKDWLELQYATLIAKARGMV